MLHSQPGTTAQRIPVNVYETTEALVIVAPMPGVMPEDVEIRLTDGEARLHANLRTPAQKEYLLHEWEYGDYDRAVPLPPEFGGPVRATLGNGQLAVTIAREGDRGDSPTVHPEPAGERGYD